MAQTYKSPVLRSIHALFTQGASGVLSDEQLLERLGQGREAGAETAFEALLVRHGGMVWSVCRNVLQNTNDAEDAFQASFLVLLRNCGSIRNARTLSSWLHGVAYRIALRSKTTADQNRSRPAIDADAIAGPESPALRSDELALLHEELNRLPEKYRTPILLYYFEGQTSDEVAERLGWPVGTVSGRLTRARALLRTRLARRGLAPAIAFVGAALANRPVRAEVPERILEHALATFYGGPAQVSLLAPAVTSAVATLSRAAFPAGSLLPVKWAAAVALAGLTLTTSAGMGEQDPAPGEARTGQASKDASQTPSQDAQEGSVTVAPGKNASPKTNPGELASLEAERKLKQAELAEAEARLEKTRLIVDGIKRLASRRSDEALIEAENHLAKDQLACRLARDALKRVEDRLNLAKQAAQDAEPEDEARRDFTVGSARADLAALEAERKLKQGKLAEAEARVELATKNFSRFRGIANRIKHAVSQEELDKAESELKIARAVRDQAGAELEGVAVRLNQAKQAGQNARVGAGREFALEIAKSELAALEAQRKAKEAELEEAEAKLASATNNLDSTRRLNQQRVVSAAEVALVESGAKVAKSGVAIARARLEEANVRLELGKRAMGDPETISAWLEHAARPSSLAPLENRLTALEHKLDQILEVLSRPKQER